MGHERYPKPETGTLKNRFYAYKIRSCLLLAIYCLVINVFCNNNACAWTRHNILTGASIQEISWLSNYELITVTTPNDQNSDLNPNYKPLYINPEPEQQVLTPPKFVYYDLSPKNKYGFQGAKPGEKISAAQIIKDFSDEPDWGMDQKLDLGLDQKFMGGSQGYRHMYYPAYSWHLPKPFIAQGKAPQRATRFYQLAGQAFEKGNYYWGFRHLARTIHYIQDMAQPYHTTQTAWAFFHLFSLLDGTTETTKNYHFAYESLVARVLELETSGKLPKNYLKVLEETSALNTTSVEELTLSIARESKKLSENTFSISIQLFGEKLIAKHPVPLTASEVEIILKHPKRAEFDQQVRTSLKLIAAGTKSLLNLAHKEFQLGEGQ